MIDVDGGDIFCWANLAALECYIIFHSQLANSIVEAIKAVTYNIKQHLTPRTLWMGTCRHATHQIVIKNCSFCGLELLKNLEQFENSKDNNMRLNDKIQI